MPVLHHGLQLDALHAQRQWIRSFSSPPFIRGYLYFACIFTCSFSKVKIYIFIYFLITYISQYTVSIFACLSIFSGRLFCGHVGARAWVGNIFRYVRHAVPDPRAWVGVRVRLHGPAPLFGVALF